MIYKYINKMSNIQALCYPWHVLFKLNIYIVSVKKFMSLFFRTIWGKLQGK